MSEEYSIKEIVERNFEQQNETLRRIEEQVRVTNGRVSKLEDFRALAKGAIAVIVVVLLPVVLSVIDLWLAKQ